MLRKVNDAISVSQDFIIQHGGKMSADGSIIKLNGNITEQSIQDEINSKIFTINQNLNPNTYKSISMITT